LTPREAIRITDLASPRLPDAGRMSAREQILGLLANRLRLVDAMCRHPEALERPIERPVIVVGLPRTGTSHLHQLLAQHPDLRFHPYWESLEPVPPPDERNAPGEADPRIARAQASIERVLAVMPLFQAMHELSAEGPHEEINLLATDFATPLFDAQYHIPSWSLWYRSADHTASYAWLRRCLQVLQFLRDGAPEEGSAETLLIDSARLRRAARFACEDVPSSCPGV